VASLRSVRRVWHCACCEGIPAPRFNIGACGKRALPQPMVRLGAALAEVAQGVVAKRVHDKGEVAAFGDQFNAKTGIGAKIGEIGIGVFTRETIARWGWSAGLGNRSLKHQ